MEPTFVALEMVLNSPLEMFCPLELSSSMPALLSSCPFLPPSTSLLPGKSRPKIHQHGPQTEPSDTNRDCWWCAHAHARLPGRRDGNQRRTDTTASVLVPTAVHYFEPNGRQSDRFGWHSERRKRTGHQGEGNSASVAPDECERGRSNLEILPAK